MTQTNSEEQHVQHVVSFLLDPPRLGGKTKVVSITWNITNLEGVSVRYQCPLWHHRGLLRRNHFHLQSHPDISWINRPQAHPLTSPLEPVGGAAGDTDVKEPSRWRNGTTWNFKQDGHVERMERFFFCAHAAGMSMLHYITINCWLQTSSKVQSFIHDCISFFF